jgi:hypothetical protein
MPGSIRIAGRIASGCFAALLVAALPAASARAQWSPDATMDLGVGFGQMALSQSALSGTRMIGSTSGKAFRAGRDDADEAPKAKAAPPLRGSLSFRSVASVTRGDNQRFVDWQSERHPELRAQLAEGIESGDLQRYFQGVLSRYGYARDNLADVSAAYYLSLWRIVHGREPTPRQIAGVRRQLRGFMAREPRLMQLPDAQKQEICETFALHTALALQGYDQLVESRDARTLAGFRAGLQAKLAPQGPDLAQMQLSDEGFVSAP